MSTQIQNLLPMIIYFLVVKNLIILVCGRKKHRRAELQFLKMSKAERPTDDASVQNVDGIIKFLELVGNLKVRIIFTGKMT